MAVNPTADQMVGILRETVVALVRRGGPDLSARQLGVFLTCYLLDGGHTVRGLAAELNVSKPAITRALDRLGELDLARRKVDPLDRPACWGSARRKAPPFCATCIRSLASRSTRRSRRKAAARLADRRHVAIHRRCRSDRGREV